MKSGWVLRVEIVTEKTPYTKDLLVELERLFKDSEIISNWRISELPLEVITLFNKKETTP